MPNFTPPSIFPEAEKALVSLLPEVASAACARVFFVASLPSMSCRVVLDVLRPATVSSMLRVKTICFSE